ncbi:MAG: hypothetical protein MUP04_11335, partial [Anaerolineae bacterium]|nr:hypothetical protein [Anaerolineae bacterium]
YKPNHYPLEDYYDENRPNEWMYPRASKNLLMESRLWSERIDYSHRYVTEDIACGLAFLISAADYVGVDILSSVEGQRYVIDVNGIPGWRGQQMTTDIDFADKIIKQVLGTL